MVFRMYPNGLSKLPKTGLSKKIIGRNEMMMQILMNWIWLICGDDPSLSFFYCYLYISANKIHMILNCSHQPRIFLWSSSGLLVISLLVICKMKSDILKGIAGKGKPYPIVFSWRVRSYFGSLFSLLWRSFHSVLFSQHPKKSKFIIFQKRTKKSIELKKWD